MKVDATALTGVVALVAAVATPAWAAQSVFVSPEQTVAFGLSIPADANNNDIYFSLALPYGGDWAAIGFGSARGQMAGALMLMIYPSASSQNTTFSPRLSTGNNEPVYYDGLDYTMLSGSGLVDNGSTYLYNAVCHNCRQWPNGGYFNVSDSAQEFIFATGPDSSLQSDDPRAALHMHFEYGTFTMNLNDATGSPGPVVLDAAALANANATSALTSDVEGKRDWTAVAHSVLMVGCFYGIFPFGALVLRIGNWARVHGAIQVLGLVGVIIGSALGIRVSSLYNRGKSFSSAHQIIGLVVFAFVIVQFTLGFLHHKQFKKTQQPTKLAPIHVWLGRIVILLGVTNGFLGFPLALAPGYNYVLAGLVIAIAPMFVFVLLMKRCFERKRARRAQEEQDHGHLGYNATPWDVPYQEPMHAPPPVYSADNSFEMGSVPKEQARATNSTAVPEQRPAQFA